jgi:hypothetical protein
MSPDAWRAASYAVRRFAIEAETCTPSHRELMNEISGFLGRTPFYLEIAPRDFTPDTKMACELPAFRDRRRPLIRETPSRLRAHQQSN